ncbi:MAG: hypothetical protein FIA82_09915 [Melioribacter sp.]|nr:hypothetical protein [Melioribacter sp.]
MKNSLIKYWAIVVPLLFMMTSLTIADNLILQEEVQFKQIKIEDGLSQSTILCMIQDKKGFLWFGTANGLNRYDGYNFTVFTNDPADTTSISDNGILSLFEDKDENIWIGTVEGVLNKFDKKSGIFSRFYFTNLLKTDTAPDERYYDFPLPFSRNNDKSITSITQDKNGFLWIGTWGKGLVKLDISKNKYEHFHYNEKDPNGFRSNRVKAIITDENNIIWVATLGGGLYRITTGEKTSITHYSKNNNAWSLSDDKIVSLMKDRKGNLWIGTYGSGLNKLSNQYLNFSPEKARFERFVNHPSNSNSLSNNFVMTIIQDKVGAIWLGTFGGGLNRLDPDKQKFNIYKNDPKIQSSLTKNDVLSILEDRSGSLWIGTHLGKGLSKLEHNTVKFKQINKDINGINGLNDDVVWAIEGDETHNLWIGTYKGGLNKYDRKSKKFSCYTSNPGIAGSISDNHIRSILDDGNGFLWIGTYSGGLNIFNKSTGKSKHYVKIPGDSTSIGANQVQSIFKDRDQNIWLATFGGGLNKLSNADIQSDRFSFKRYTNNHNDPFSISDNRVYTIFQDADGILWIGTFGGGLNKFDPKTERFISYKNILGDESSISDNRVMTIYEDSMQNLWIGTYGGSIQRFNKQTERFTRYNKKNKIGSSVVYGILEDNQNNLWMSTDNGLIKFNAQTENFTQYDLHDGLQSLEFSGGAYYKSKNGEMFFGGINGLNYFYPDSVLDNKYVPPIVISSVRIFNEPVRGERDTLVLSYSQNFFSFEFAALDYTNPDDNQYAYKLEGFEDDWRYVDSRRRIANYTNLLPGEYVFRVRGSNNDGIWNNDGAKIYLKILPPIWRTWWFLTLSILIVAFIIYYLSTIRYRGLLAIEKLKGKLAADLHDNVGSGLTEISILSELAAKQIQSSSQHLVSISDKARQLIDNMSDIVWMVNPQRDSFYHLILRLKDTYSDLLNLAGISFKTSNLEELSSLKIPMEHKQNLYLMFKEGINNSIKHSKCKKITLEANLKKDELELILKDDGIGLDASNKIHGNGLLNMKNRASAIGGELTINSSDEGTTIVFKGKLSGIRNIILSRLK